MNLRIYHHPLLIRLLVGFLSIFAFSVTSWTSVIVLEGLPHIEDEMAYDWQAQLISRGILTIPSPEPCPKCFLVPFVVDHHGLRFGKYPIGWPVVLAFGHLEIFNFFPYARNLINPLLAAVSVGLIYQLAKKISNERTAILAAVLTCLSPFFWMNSALMLSHPLAFFLTITFSLGWLDTFIHPNPKLPQKIRHTLPLTISVLSMSLLVLTRPMTAIAVAVPFGVHGLFLLVKRFRLQFQKLFWFCLTTGVLSSLYFLWQYAVTGDPFLNPFVLWWPYDKIGFGEGVGLQPGGYSPVHGLQNTYVNLFTGASDLFGWPGISWLFMPFGLIAIRRNRQAWIVFSILPSLIAAYFLYWMTARLVGPRYYYEGLFSAVFISSAGIIWIFDLVRNYVKNNMVFRIPFVFKAHVAPGIRSKIYISLLFLVLTILTSYNLIFYLPERIQSLRGLYGVSKSCFNPFETETARQSIPALVMVQVTGKWIEYGCLLDKSSPFMDSDFVFMISYGQAMDKKVASTMPERNLLYYNPITKVLVKVTDSLPRE